MEMPSAVSTEQKTGVPVVYANPPLDNLALLYSVPVYKEWRNGFLVRHVHAILSQRFPRGESIEANYIVNNGSSDQKVSPNLFRRETLEDSVDAMAFLQAIIAHQAYARSTVDIAAVEPPPPYRDEPLLKDTFDLAARRAREVAISAIDVRGSDLEALGYRGRRISQLRTVGADYAFARLPNPSARVSLMDTDTLPSDNVYSRDVNRFFHIHKDASFLFTGMGYQPAGKMQELVADSPKFSLNKMAQYNPHDTKGSPQIVFRAASYENLQEVNDGFSTPDGVVTHRGYEDFVTARRLVGFLGREAAAVLQDTVREAFPFTLTSDREGNFDGNSRYLSAKMSRETSLGDALAMVDRERKLLRGEIALKQSTPAERVMGDYLKARVWYGNRQRFLLRLYRGVTKSFLKGIDNGVIIKGQDTIAYDEQQVLSLPKGRLLSHYLRNNQALLGSFSAGDIEYLRYLVSPGTERSESRVPFAALQRSMREYLGDFRGDIVLPIPFGSEDSIPSISQRYAMELSLDKNASFFYPVTAELLALGFINEKYLLGEQVTQKYRELRNTRPNPRVAPGVRSTWIPSSYSGK